MACYVSIIGLAISLASVFPAHSLAVEGPPRPMSAAQRKVIDGEMLKLETTTRVEQRCNARAMGIVRREHWPMNPDEGAVRAFADPEVVGRELHATGAAIRSRGNWYRIAYDCVTSDNGLDIKSFSYALGSVVPRSDWQAHYLGAP
jgi:hypothetical protein